MYLLYTLGLGLALLLAAPYWAWQATRHGKYRSGLAERLGFVPQRLKRSRDGVSVWLHAVSVGEVIAVTPLVSELRARGAEVFVSTTTPTGQKLARQRFGDEFVFYFPLDFGYAVQAYLSALRPRLVLLAETEFWPNFLRLAAASGARIAVVNARLSDRSFPRYLRARAVMRRLLAKIDVFATQSQLDAERLRALGSPAECVHVAGNLKFDVPAPVATELVTQMRAALPAGAACIVCGSTVEDEEPLVLEAFRNRVLASEPNSLLALAPRHPERFDWVAAQVESQGLRLLRRSQWSGQPLAGTVFLVDTIGELAALYQLATVAIVAGSFADRGGHNILEPAQFGVPIVVGPHTENFRDIINIFQREKAVLTAQPRELGAVLSRLLADAAERQQLGQRALQVFRSQAGATARTLALLQPLLKDSTAAAGKDGSA